jgi:putative phosphoesterase
MKTLVISDVHANLAALRAVLDHESGWDGLVFLGDAVLGGPQPNEVLDLLRSLDGVFIMGNHDRQALDTDVSGEATEPHRRWNLWTARTLTPVNRGFMESFRSTEVIETQGMRLRLVHGQLPEEARDRWPGRYVWPDSPEAAFRALAGDHCESIILHGHNHIQSRVRFDGVEFVNPGGLGQPRLGKPLACYAVIEDAQIHLRAVPYGVEETCMAMAKMDLDADFIAMWQEIYRRGRLAPRYLARDLSALEQAGFR